MSTSRSSRSTSTSRYSTDASSEETEIRWTFADVTKARQAALSKIIQHTGVEIHCVLDGDHGTKKFIPSPARVTGGPEPVDLTAELDVPRGQINGNLDDDLDNSDEQSASALSKCKCRLAGR